MRDEQVERIRYYGEQYRALIARGYSERDAAAVVDKLMVEDKLVRRLHREPTEAEIEAEMQKL